MANSYYSSSIRRGASDQLQSTIPKLTPYVRARPVAKRATSSSCMSQASRPARTGIPTPTFRSADRGKHCSTFKNQSIFDTATVPRKTSWSTTSKQTPAPPTKAKVNNRPMSAAPAAKSPNSNIRSKINSKVSPKSLKSQLKSGDIPRPHTAHEYTTTEKSQVASEADTEISCDHSKDKAVKFNDITEKQRVLLKIDKQLKELEPADDLKPLENEILHLLQSKTLNQLDNFVRENAAPKQMNSFICSEVPAEFLTTFEAQMQQLAKSWLELINNITATHLEIGNDVMSRLILPDPSLNLREELYRFLSTLPTEGEPLHVKLKKIEEEHMTVMATAITLTRQYEDLKDKYFRLEKTQDQIHFELKQELKLLNEENKELVKRCDKAVDAYNAELLKTQRLEENKKAIHRDSEHIKKQIKLMERKCVEFETKLTNCHALSRTIDVAIRNKDLALEKCGKKYNEISAKLKQLQEVNNNMEEELTKANKNNKYLEMDKSELKEEVSSLKSSLDESEQKRTELVDELSYKTKKLEETQRDLDQLIARSTNNGIPVKSKDEKEVLIDDLTRQVKLNDITIKDMEKNMQNKSANEEYLKQKVEYLKQQVNELKHKPQELEVALKSKITELEYKVKDLGTENEELEKMVAQKTLELDNQDLLNKQHAQLLHTRDHLIPMLRNKQRNEQECIERLSAVVFEHQRTNIQQEPNSCTMSPMERYRMIDPDMTDEELEFRQEKMKEMFSLLENKQMEIMRLERRLRDMQGKIQEREEHINTLETARLNQHGPRPRGFFSMFSGHDR